MPRPRLTVLNMMISVAVIALMVWGSLTAVRLIRLSRYYQKQAVKHGRDEMKYRKIIDFDRNFLRMPRSGGAIQGLVLHEEQADHHHALKRAYERASWRPWVPVPPEPPEPTWESLRTQFGPHVMRIAAEHKLKFLDLSEMGLTDEQLASIAGCTEVISLDLSYNPITDRGLGHLRGLKKLSLLNLTRTQVTDAGLDRLKGLTSLIELNVSRTNVTKIGLGLFNNSMPNVYLEGGK